MTVEFHAEVQPTANGPKIRVCILADDEILRLPHAEAQAKLSDLLHQVRFAPEFTLYGYASLASYVTPPPRAALHGYNTWVEVSLPYTLHLPSGMVFEMNHQQIGKAAIIARKVWTKLATGSNEAEIYAENQSLYYGPVQPISPFIPQAPELGPWPHFTGINVEIAKDTHGVFRYTQLRVLFDSNPIGIRDSQTDEEKSEAKSNALSWAKQKTTEIINHLIDVYGYVTGAEHIERLSELIVNSIYFADENLVSDGIRIESGLGSAIVNRSGEEILRIKNMLLTGAEPERHVLLLQGAHASLNRGQVVLAVVVAFQALEILLENKLRIAYGKLGSPESKITEKLKKYYRTKDRLTVLSREVTGGSSVEDDSTFWNSWLIKCNRKRNGVVHKNEVLTSSEAKVVVDLCEECMKRLSALPFPA